MVVILQLLMVKSPGRSAFTGIQAVVNGPQTYKWETAALSMFITSAVHRTVISAIVALIKLKKCNYCMYVVSKPQTFTK